MIFKLNSTDALVHEEWTLANNLTLKMCKLKEQLMFKCTDTKTVACQINGQFFFHKLDNCTYKEKYLLEKSL